MVRQLQQQALDQVRRVHNRHHHHRSDPGSPLHRQRLLDRSPQARTDELTNSIATLTDETTRHAALAVSAEKEWRATTAQLQKVEAQSESMRTEHTSKTAAVKQHEEELKRAAKEALEEADAAVAAASNDKAEAGALEADREEMLGEIDDMDSVGTATFLVVMCDGACAEPELLQYR